MSTKSREEALSPEEVRSQVAAAGFPRGLERAGSQQVGLEPELFGLAVTDDGCPGERLPLFGTGGVLETIDALRAEVPWIGPRDPQAGSPRYDLAHGGTLTFEPGGQIEHSTAIHRTAAEAIADVDRVRETLCAAFRARSARLCKMGVDPWHDAADVPQMLRAPRYSAMAEYFEKRSSLGRVMMRNTATIQVNLDLGPLGVDLERWQVANLASPLVTATFASSPSAAGAAAELVSVRADAWQQLDPTRTGFPRHVTDGPFDDPQLALVEAALSADVLLFRLPDGGAEAGEPGFRFLDWLTAGHPEHGWPTDDDLAYHLTTLFHEVRCRGFFELRAGEALPEPWGVVPVVFQTGLLYDPEALAAARALLWPHRGALQDLWLSAAKHGVRAPQLGELCVRTWELALLGARRLGAGYFEEAHLARAEEFLSRFTRQGRMPADELREALARCAIEALSWCAGDAPCGEAPPAGKGLAIA